MREYKKKGIGETKSLRKSQGLCKQKRTACKQPPELAQTTAKVSPLFNVFSSDGVLAEGYPSPPV